MEAHLRLLYSKVPDALGRRKNHRSVTTRNKNKKEQKQQKKTPINNLTSKGIGFIIS